MPDKKLLSQVRAIFFRSKEIIVVLSLFFASIVGAAAWQMTRAISTLYDDAALGALDIPLKFSLASFAVFSFLAFEMSYKLRRYKLDECMNTVAHAKRKIFLAQGVIFVVIILIFFAFFNIWSLLLFIKYRNFNCWHGKFIIQTVLNMLLSHFFVPCCAAAMGMSASLLFRRINGCLGLVLFVLLGSPLSNYLGEMLYEFSRNVSINIFPLLRLFDIFPPALNYQPVYAFGQSVLPYRWLTALFWLLLSLFVISLKTGERNRRFRAAPAVFASLALAFLVVSQLPASRVIVGSDDPKYSMEYGDKEYYYKAYDFYSDDYDEDGANKEWANFEKEFDVTDYDLEIKVGNNLHVRAAITVDKPNLEKYDFTLYHGYKISSVRDGDGNKLRFEQDGDHFTVFNPEKKSLDRIVLKYSGFSTQYYSNLQGLFLPGYFPYYPHSGSLPVYNMGQREIYRFMLDEPTHFKVKVNSSQTVYSGLEQTGKNEFEGSTTGVTLVSGLYDCYEKDGVKMVYPYLHFYCGQEKQRAKFFDKYRSTETLPDNIKTVIIIPSIESSGGYTGYCQFDNYLVSKEILQIDEDYKNQSIEPWKFDVYQNYMNYANGNESTREFMRENGSEEGYSTYDFIQYINRVGEEEALKRMSKYLNDHNDRRTVSEFYADAD